MSTEICTSIEFCNLRRCESLVQRLRRNENSNNWV